jgi:hypothetical protein
MKNSSSSTSVNSDSDSGIKSPRNALNSFSAIELFGVNNPGITKVRNTAEELVKLGDLEKLKAVFSHAEKNDFLQKSSPTKQSKENNCQGLDLLKLLRLAITEGKAEIAEWLLQEIKVKNDNQTQGLLCHAVEEQNIDIVRLCLQHSLSPNDIKKGENGNKTALYIAIEKDNLDIVNMLLDHGADINKTSAHIKFYKKSLIEIAQESGNDKVAELLSEKLQTKIDQSNARHSQGAKNSTCRCDTVSSESIAQSNLSADITDDKYAFVFSTLFLACVNAFTLSVKCYRDGFNAKDPLTACLIGLTTFCVLCAFLDIIYIARTDFSQARVESIDAQAKSCTSLK